MGVVTSRDRYLADVNSRSRLLYAIAVASVCLSSVTFVHPTSLAEIFSNFASPFGTLAINDIHGKFYGDSSRETPPSGGYKRRRSSQI